MHFGDMKVAQISTYMTGGAAIVARRLHQGLTDRGIDSMLVSRYGTKGKVPKHQYYQEPWLRNLLRTVAFSSFFQPFAAPVRRFLEHPNLRGRPKGFEMFSLLYQDRDLNKFDFLHDYDLLHFHWVNEFVDYEPFFKKFQDKRFVWTLHDMNPFTGGCHHSDGCLKFETECRDCPQLRFTIDPDYSLIVQREKIRGLDFLRDDQITIVSPSEWLLRLSMNSKILGRFRHELIPNPSFAIPAFFRSTFQTREQLGLPLARKIIVFVSDNLKNPRKGMPVLFQAMQSLTPKDRPLLVGLGKKGHSHRGIDILYPGRVSSGELLGSYLNAADAFVTPSLAENSPLVVIEALTCGTPVIASAVGGIPELVNEDNGLLFTPGDSNALTQALEKVLGTTYDRSGISRSALGRFSLDSVSASYERLYRTLLG